MKITVVEGTFATACDFFKTDGPDPLVFELAPMNTDKEAFAEFNRFVETLTDAEAFDSGNKINAVIDLSKWNDNYSYNDYLEAFLYLLKDKEACGDYGFIFDKKASRVLMDKINGLGLFELFTVTLDFTKEDVDSKKVRIGFAVSEQKEA